MDANKAKALIASKGAVLVIGEIRYKLSDIITESIVTNKALGELAIEVVSRKIAVERINSDNVELDKILYKENKRHVSYSTWYIVILDELLKRQDVVLSEERKAIAAGLEKELKDIADKKFAVLSDEEKKNFYTEQENAINEKLKAVTGVASSSDDAEY
jgi:hypothetical protein